MKRNKLSKPILLSTLVFGQCAGTVAAMQNSIVSVYAETGYTEKGHSEKGYYGYVPNAFDNEYDYFKDQLTAYKLYKISDIIMDKALRDTNNVQK